MLLSFFMCSALSCSPPVPSSIGQNCYNSELELEITHEFEKKLQATSQADPVLILIGGFQGSGKSSLIKRIEGIYSSNVISTDCIRQSLFDRGRVASPEFSISVSNIFRNLLEKSLTGNANTLIDANSHSKRITEIESLLLKNNSHYSTIKIFLQASESTLRNRIKTREPSVNCYQGTESDLEATLLSTTVNPEDYNLIVDTDTLNENDVFEVVKDFISPYLGQQSV